MKLYIFIAFCFAIFTKLIPFAYTDIEYIISNPDGYYFAKYTKLLVKDQIVIADIPSNANLSIILYFIYNIVQFLNLNDFLFFITVILSSSIIIPIILIAKELGDVRLGFVASLFASLSSYYERTTLGRLDTDFLAILFPLFMVYFLIRIYNKYNIKCSSAWLVFVVIGYIWLYPSGVYLTIFILIFSFAFGLFFYKSLFPKKIIFIIIIGIVVYIIVNFDSLRIAFNHYVLWHDVSSNGLEFYNTKNILSETHKLTIIEAINTISGSIYVFLIGFIGFLSLIYKEKKYVLLVPIFILGLMVFVSGSRYGFYAWIVLSFGLAYVVIVIIQNKFIQKHYISNLLLSLIMILFLYSNFDLYKNSHNYMSKSYCDNLFNMRLSNHDIFLSTNRNGYMLQYYTKANTFIDGGRHSGKLQYPTSRIFLEHNQTIAHKLINILSDNFHNGHYDINNISKKYGYSSIDEFFKNIKSIDIKSNMNSYIYITDKMLDLLNTFYQYGYVDLKSGKVPHPLNYFIAEKWNIDKQFLYFPNGIRLTSDLKYIVFKNTQYIPVNKYIELDYKDKLNKKITLLNSKATVSVMYVKHLHKIFVFDNIFYNSFVIQLYLENYDHTLYKKIFSTPRVRMYRLK